ncbi:cytochrome c peroxidase [Litoreibacter halocynthiae]|uniref:Cytochrome c peroxidase n=1 Tax=Litoreibacter halocynthiae TaxID=1242689 RepID=A0A4V3EX94_9RHOB|nr:cytochrome c peroxidase [Litoreibacter halocynthiae]TDT75625.1 cytochrome c peroxidase [Litoreibacter halocynthiae]
MRLFILGLMTLIPSYIVAGELPAPVTDADYRSIAKAEAELGQLLFYDPILSGNKEVACATCHHPRLGTSDGLSLGIGDGGIGLGPDRVVDPNNLPEQRIPRNAPALFNLGANEFTVLFHDGRIALDPSRPSGLRTPLDDDMVTGFASLLSAQTMFPVLSADEMAGHYSENDVAKAVRQGLLTGQGGAWDIIARRVAALPDYVERFTTVYPHINSADQIGFTDISNAIATFMEFEWRSDTSPFDAFLRDQQELSELASEGMTLFYGDAGCSTCHSRAFQTDHKFHAMGAPQIGPGKAARFESHAKDEGRFRVTGDPSDLYKFRTPSLRNVAITAPYGHAGSHASLQAFIKDHLDPVAALKLYDPAQLVLPQLQVDDLRALEDSAEMSAIVSAVEQSPVHLTDAEIASLTAFLNSLTDPDAMLGRLGVPDTVPSGLRVPN